jgi:hypothetical protein
MLGGGGCFTPWEGAPGTHYIGGWVGPGAGLDVVEKKEISCPCQESNPDRPARSYTDIAIPTLYNSIIFITNFITTEHKMY